MDENRPINKEDKYLVKEYLEGNESAFNELVLRHIKIVYNTALRFAGGREADAEDIVSETFLKVWRNLRSFDSEKNFKAWILVIARNSAIDLLRKKKAIPFSSIESSRGLQNAEEIFADGADLPDVIFDEKIEEEKIKEAYGKLPEKYKLIISLRSESDLSFSEIAEVLNASHNTLKSQYRRALLLLKKYLGK